MKGVKQERKATWRRESAGDGTRTQAAKKAAQLRKEQRQMARQHGR